jgi:hypothetical protein
MIPKKIAAFICCAFICSVVTAQPVVSPKDFQVIIGSWQGSLTYLDYTTNKPFTMPANIDIKQKGRSNTFYFTNSFPNEPNANWTDTIILSTDGTMINKETVKAKQVLANGNLEIVIEQMGVDGNEQKPALLKYTYTMGRDVFIKRKDVLFTGTTEWVKRHEYNYAKKRKQ